MKELRVELNNDRAYPIYIGSGLIKQKDTITRHIRSQQVAIVSNDTIAPLYLSMLLELLDEYQTLVIEIPDGEQYKNLAYLEKIFDRLLEHKFSRNATLIALGGGVIGDLTGFAAACYQRGIAFIQIPTTLLSQVDSSVGGKTGVNHRLGKNMIGAFYQPQCVIADTDLLDSLPNRELSAGLAEVIKYGLIRDYEFLQWLENNMQALLSRNKPALAYAIERSCINKAEVVAADEFESGLRATLNLGHTFGHAIETGCGYGQYLHGEAVAIGCCFAADLSRRLGWLTTVDVTRITAIFREAGLPTTPPAELKAERYIELMAVDKKNIDGKIRVILLEALGKASLPVQVEIQQLLETLTHYAG
jgi:3-dehydroquinate synthase